MSWELPPYLQQEAQVVGYFCESPAPLEKTGEIFMREGAEKAGIAVRALTLTEACYFLPKVEGLIVWRGKLYSRGEEAYQIMGIKTQDTKMLYFIAPAQGYVV